MAEIRLEIFEVLLRGLGGFSKEQAIDFYNRFVCEVVDEELKDEMVKFIKDTIEENKE